MLQANAFAEAEKKAKEDKERKLNEMRNKLANSNVGAFKFT